MLTQRKFSSRFTAVLLLASLAVAGCGAGAKTGAKTAEKTNCDFTAPAQDTKINLLAYNSSAIDPFTNTMVASCSHDKVTITHDPIDFPGQKTKTASTLAGSSGSYDIVETYSLVIPTYAAKLEPLDDLYAKYKDKYKLGDLDPTMVKGMSYGGHIYGLPTQANVTTMAFRKDIFDELKLKAPTTFEELTAAAKTIQASGKVKFPVALPLLASSDISTQYMNGLLSQGVAYTDAAGKSAALTTPQSEAALTALKNLAPFMDPQVTTFDQPKVQQQMYNGTAAIAIMYSGRMADLINAKNSKLSADFGFAQPPAIKAGGKPWGVVSVDGWSIPKNMKLDRDLLFQIMAASISAEAGASSLPAAYPSRKGLVTPDKVPYASAVQSTLAGGATTPPPFPWVSDLQAATRPFVAQVVTGELSPKDAMSKMQTAATAVLAKAAG